MGINGKRGVNDGELDYIFFFQAEDGIRDKGMDWSSDVCSSDLGIIT